MLDWMLLIRLQLSEGPARLMNTALTSGLTDTKQTGPGLQGSRPFWFWSGVMQILLINIRPPTFSSEPITCCSQRLEQAFDHLFTI